MLWQSERQCFAADSTVLGRSISLDGQFFTVIGVMPTGFTFPNEADFWVPVSLSADASNATLQFLARVKPGVSLESARNEAAAILHQLEQERHRPVGEGVRITLTPLAEVVGAEHSGPEPAQNLAGEDFFQHGARGVPRRLRHAFVLGARPF